MVETSNKIEFKRGVSTITTGLINKVSKLESQLQQCKEALIWSRAEYLHTLDTNPDCSAWDLDELSEEEQEKYKEDAKKSLAYEGFWFDEETALKEIMCKGVSQ